MKPGELPVPADVDGEIAGLIQTLHETSQRLEDLTVGEVDSVADREGRAFLLRHAQEHLRETEAAKQGAILNALPAHIALIDPQGVIRSVNEAWRGFARDNVLLSPGYAIGANYLEVCDASRGPDSPDALRAAAGIRAVLRGGLEVFSFEYPCHSPTEQRWFLLTVTPMADGRLGGAVVMHLNVTTERLAKEELYISETRFRQMAENILDVFFLRDADGKRMLYVSPAYAQLWGRSCESLYAEPESWIEGLHPDDRAATVETYHQGLLTGTLDIEYRIVRPDGSVRWVEARGFPVMDGTEKIARVAGVAKDITERKEAEARIAYLNRLYSTLSGINTLIVRAQDRDELFREACRIAVNQGGFKVALVLSVAGDGGTKLGLRGIASSDPAMVCAIEDYTSRFDGAPTDMARQAICEKRFVVSNDTQGDPAIAYSRLHAAFGIRSMAVLPLIVAGEVVGVFALYAGEKEFFHAQELVLLTELVGDIAFAIGNIDGLEKLARAAEEKKRDSEAMLRFAGAMDAVADAILLIDRQTMRFVHANETACRYMGKTRNEVLSLDPCTMLSVSRTELERAYDLLIASGKDSVPQEVEVSRPDGSRVWIETRRRAQRQGDRWTIISLIRDITEGKRAAQSLQESTQRLDAIVTSAMDAILTVDGEYRIVLANPAALLMFGYTGAELEGQSLDVLLPARFRAAHSEHIAGFGRSGVTSRRMGELRPVSGLRKDGEEFPIEASISTDASSGHKFFTAILRDVTERLRAEETVHDLNVSLERRVAVRTLELESANRELEEFGRTIAHDLRAPVRAIAGFSGALRQALAGTLDPVAENYLGRVEKAAARMDAMVTDMLAFARSARAPVARAIIDMNGLVKAVLDELAGGQANGPEVACADLPPVSGDASLLRQVWTNLLSNAIKFSSKAVHPRIEIGANQNEYRVEFFVHDNGAGFDSQYRDKLFGVFQRLHTESEFPGNGVGLAIVKRIVERHGGHVSAQSTRGEGATFGFSLPRK